MSKCSCRKIAKIAWEDLRVVFSRSKKTKTREEEKKIPAQRLLPYLEMNFFDGKKGTFIVFFSFPPLMCPIFARLSVMRAWFRDE